MTTGKPADQYKELSSSLAANYCRLFVAYTALTDINLHIDSYVNSKQLQASHYVMLHLFSWCALFLIGFEICIKFLSCVYIAKNAFCESYTSSLSVNSYNYTLNTW